MNAEVISFILLILVTPVLSPVGTMLLGGAGLPWAVNFWVRVWVLYVAPSIS
jgi:hypothetical protein